MYIQKVDNKPSTIDPYFEMVFQFIGSIIVLGNSIILTLSAFFERKGMKPVDTGMMGPYIKRLKGMNVDLKLIDNLEEYDKYLNLAKHSVFIANEELIKKVNTKIELQDITTKEIHSFDEPTQKKIMKLASTIMADINRCK
jgi:hypothetical protein